MKEKIGMAHSALTNLQRLLEVTSMAMIDTKTQLSTVMRYIIIIYWTYLDAHTHLFVVLSR